jgi:hypothetical protein
METGDDVDITVVCSGNWWQDVDITVVCSGDWWQDVDITEVCSGNWWHDVDITVVCSGNWWQDVDITEVCSGNWWQDVDITVIRSGNKMARSLKSCWGVSVVKELHMSEYILLCWWGMYCAQGLRISLYTIVPLNQWGLTATNLTKEFLLLHLACWFNHFFTVATNAHLVHFETLKSPIKILNISRYMIRPPLRPSSEGS